MQRKKSNEIGKLNDYHLKRNKIAIKAVKAMLNIPFSSEQLKEQIQRNLSER